ncbi:MAG: prephenate dehydrogenase/arogenate dehydrogenase family protein [Burkholderiaceae bacterium]|nr:prephenate dehydrogenase/arogenate dehydrogenase family protein [Burkholderiaceae bacterium]
MNLALIGVGLIGGSFARAVRAAGRVNRIVGFDTQPEALQRALELGVIDDIAFSAAHAVANTDLVMIATPVGGIRAVLREIAPHLRSAAIITDVGSTKTGVIEAARAELAGVFERFVPAHPIAGSERSGLEYSHSALFRGAVCIITPSADADLNALRQVESLWNDIGCTVEQMSSEEHDRVFAAVSHLPHLLAFALVAQIASDKDAERKFAFAGAGFRDFTRIAASSPSMWSDICISNRSAISSELRTHRELLTELQRAIDEGDAESLRRIFQQAATARRGISVSVE